MNSFLRQKFKHIVFDSKAIILTIIGALVFYIVYNFHSTPLDLSERFLPSWNSYLKSFDTSPQMDAYKVFLIFCAVSASICLLFPNKINFNPYLNNIFIIGLLIINLWGITTDPWFALLLGIGLLLGVQFANDSHHRVCKWTTLSIVGIMSMFFIGTGLGGYVYYCYSGFWTSSNFSWHYGAYFGDALKIASGSSTDITNPYYGILIQNIIGIFQKYFGLWNVFDYIIFLQYGQTLILVILLIWLFKQYKITPHWIILVIVIWFSFAYNGGSGNITNGTQSILRRAGIIIFLMTLPWFGKNELKRGGWVIALHGLMVGILIPISMEFGCAIFIVCLAFWTLSTEAISVSKWIRKLFLFIFFSAVSFSITISTLAICSGGSPIKYILKSIAPFHTGIYHMSFGGLPLELTALVALLVILSTYTLFTVSSGWVIHALNLQKRLLFVCSSLSLMFIVYYLQRNGITPLHTPIIPSIFLCLFCIIDNPNRKENELMISGIKFLCTIFIFALIIFHARWFQTDLIKRCNFIKDEILHREKTINSNFKNTGESIRSIVKEKKFVLISPYYFQIVSDLNGTNLLNIKSPWCDPVYSTTNILEQDEFVKKVLQTNADLVIFDKMSKGSPFGDEQFSSQRISELINAFIKQGFGPVNNYNDQQDLIIFKK